MVFSPCCYDIIHITLSDMNVVAYWIHTATVHIHPVADKYTDSETVLR